MVRGGGGRTGGRAGNARVKTAGAGDRQRATRGFSGVLLAGVRGHVDRPGGDVHAIKARGRQQRSHRGHDEQQLDPAPSVRPGHAPLRLGSPGRRARRNLGVPGRPRRRRSHRCSMARVMECLRPPLERHGVIGGSRNAPEKPAAHAANTGRPAFRHVVPPAGRLQPGIPYRPVALFISQNGDKAGDVCGTY